MKDQLQTLEQALASDFQAYINWCFDWCRAKAAVDPIFADVWDCGNNSAMFQALWAKRYWFHKNGVAT